jgi:hypothetical protein
MRPVLPPADPAFQAAAETTATATGGSYAVAARALRVGRKSEEEKQECKTEGFHGIAPFDTNYRTAAKTGKTHAEAVQKYQ